MTAWEVDSLEAYVGLDISARLVSLNQGRFHHHSNKRFAPWDVATCPLPRLHFAALASSTAASASAASAAATAATGEQAAELVHMRYVLQHMSLDRALAAVINAVGSGAKFFMATTYPQTDAQRNASTTTRAHNKNLNMGSGRESRFYANDLELPPFSLPAPLACVTMVTPEINHNDHTCLYDLRDTAKVGRWLDRARRTRVRGSMRMTRFVVRGENYTEFARYGRRPRTADDDAAFEREERGLKPLKLDNWGNVCGDGAQRDGCAG